MLLQNLADAVCSVFLCEDFKEFFSLKNLRFLSGISGTPDCSGFLPSVLCKRLPLPDVCCLFPSAPVSAYLYLQAHHEVRSYRSLPTPHKNTIFLSHGHQTDLAAVLCFCIHAVFCMQPFSICIHPCRNMDTSSPVVRRTFPRLSVFSSAIGAYSE